MGGLSELSRLVRHQVDEMRPSERDVAVRRIWDPATDRLWRIWRMGGRRHGSGDDPAAATEASLVLDGGDVVRRIAPAPADWERCSDAELLALAHGAPLGNRWRERVVAADPRPSDVADACDRTPTGP